MDKKKIKKELQELIIEGRDIHYAGVMEYDKDYLKENGMNELDQQVAKDALKNIIYPKRTYHSWYDKAYEMVRILFPRRLDQFKDFYTGTQYKDSSKDLTHMTAGITHYLQGNSIILNGKIEGFFYNFNMGLNQQRDILIAMEKNIDHELFNLERDIHHDIYKSELDIAKDLNKQGYLRASGAIAGVILEVHLKNLATNRDVMPKKKDPGMSDYNDALKDSIYDIATWRQIQTCGDIRNLCVHPKEAEPTKYQIDTIISTVEIIITTYN